MNALALCVPARVLPVLLVALQWAAGQAKAKENVVGSGEKVAFLGDSITAQGWGNPAGYVRLIVAGLKANGIEIDVAPAGIGSHKSNDMLARFDRDVLSKQPQWMTLSCGVYDVAQDEKGVPLDDEQAAAKPYLKTNPSEPDKGTFKKNIAQIVEKAQAGGIKVMLLTATPIGEDLKGAKNQKLAAYNDFLCQLAREKHALIADLNALFQQRIKMANEPGKNVCTVDGIHMNAEGNKLMATGVLETFGLDAAQIKKAQEAWKPLEAQAEEEAKVVAAAKAKAAAEKAAEEKPSLPGAK